MRVVEAENYIEPRDALAHDWSRFMSTVLPQARWMPVPNLGKDVIDFVKHWQLNSFILTGGNNLFECEIRDETEFVLLEYAMQEKLPVLGVCRGMQVMCYHFGGEILACPDTSRHVATTHLIHFQNDIMNWNEQTLEVNSFHENCVGLPEIFDGQLEPFAVSEDGIVEGVKSRDGKMMGIMWHPERENPAFEFDEYLIKSFLFR